MTMIEMNLKITSFIGSLGGRGSAYYLSGDKKRTSEVIVNYFGGYLSAGT
jgi:hypothetical protein